MKAKSKKKRKLPDKAKGERYVMLVGADSPDEKLRDRYLIGWPQKVGKSFEFEGFTYDESGIREVLAKAGKRAGYAGLFADEMIRRIKENAGSPILLRDLVNAAMHSAVKIQ